MGLQQQNKNYKNFHLKSFPTNLYNKISKNLKSSIFMPFSTGIGLDFYVFLATCKKSKKSLLPPPLIFGRIPKCFNTAVLTFLSSSSEPKTTYTCYAIQ